MFLGLRTIVYPAPDLATSKAFYEKLLGFAPYFDEPFYVGFNVGGYELGLVPDAAASETYWGVTGIQEAWKDLQARGARPKEEPKDVGGGIWVATLLDPHGNTVGIIENPHFKLP